MKPSQHFAAELLATLAKSKGLRIRAGTGNHRFIGIWFVLVKERVFVRSWSLKPDGWYRKLQHDPNGSIHIKNVEVAIRAVPTKSKPLRDAIDRAYLEKYNSKGELKYAKDLGQEKSRATTMELVPLKESASSLGSLPRKP